jgi:hypothetical protein
MFTADSINLTSGPKVLLTDYIGYIDQLFYNNKITTENLKKIILNSIENGAWNLESISIK